MSAGALTILIGAVEHFSCCCKRLEQERRQLFNELLANGSISIRKRRAGYSKHIATGIMATLYPSLAEITAIAHKKAAPKGTAEFREECPAKGQLGA